MNKSISSTVFPISISNNVHYLILFLLWPFMAFLTALANYSHKNSKKVVYLFLIYYGLTFVLGNIGVDAERYAWDLKDTAELPFSEIYAVVGGLYTDTTVDVIQPLVTFIVSRFTSSHNVLFAVWAAIFGFFYLKSINLLHGRYRENPGWNAFIYMAFFVMIMPITTVGGIRMPTATWVFFLGAYHVILYRDARYLLISLSASLIHWSFLTANAILIIYFFAGNRNVFYLPVTLASFIIPGLLSPIFQTLATTLGGPIQERYENYSSEGFILGVQESNEAAPWFLTLGHTLTFYFFLLAIVVIQFTGSNMVKDKSQRNLFSFILIFLAFVNFAKVIPTFGGRFQETYFLFATLYIFLYYVKKPGKNIDLLTLLGIFPMLLYAVVMFRVGAISVNAWILTPGCGLPLLLPELSFADVFFP
jgi:hypothetical protein